MDGSVSSVFLLILDMGEDNLIWTVEKEEWE